MIIIQNLKRKISNKYNDIKKRITCHHEYELLSDMTYIEEISDSRIHYLTYQCVKCGKKKEISFHKPQI